MSRYETLLLELLRQLDEKADRIASALERLSPPGGQGREAIGPVITAEPANQNTPEDGKALVAAICKALSK